MQEPNREPDLVLYSTSACHLCELAEALLLPLVEQGLLVAVDDIAESDALFARYGERIPVVTRPATGAELDWPFSAEDLSRLLA
jgi:hypothetical protein